MVRESDAEKVSLLRDTRLMLLALSSFLRMTMVEREWWGKPSWKRCGDQQ